MSLSLENVPYTFQRVMDVHSSASKWKLDTVYLEDLVIFFKKIRNHIDHETLTHSLLKDTGITPKSKECAFFTKRTDYLCQVIKNGKLELASQTADDNRNLYVAAVVNKPRPTFGLCNVFRWVVASFARTASTISKILSNIQATELERLANENWKHLIRQERSLFPRRYRVYRRVKDSTVSILTPLTDRWAVYFCRSRMVVQKNVAGIRLKPTDQDKNLDRMHHKCLAFVWTVLLSQLYLEICQCTLELSHYTLWWFHNLANATEKLVS